MKILYGVCGDGMGHAMRSSVVARHLLGRGHRVQFVCSSGRAGDFLKNKFGTHSVVDVVGLHIVAENGVLNHGAAIAHNLARQVLAAPFMHVIAGLKVETPDVVISDFDPWSARFAKLLRRPLIAIDNCHFLTRCQHPSDFISGDRQTAALTYVVANRIVPNAQRYLVTTIAGADVIKENTTLHAPIVRDEVRSLGGRMDDGFIAVYFNEHADHANNIAKLQRLGKYKFSYFGATGVTESSWHGNVTVEPVGHRFLNRLAGCSAIVGGAGFTLISEALFLRKPILAKPFGGQFEQVLNANYLERLGYGRRATELDEETVDDFLSSLPVYRKNLQGYQHDGNAELLASVDRAIAELS